MTVLVMGGCGFIGRNVVSELVKYNTSILVFDVNADASWSTEALTYVKGEFSDVLLLESLFIRFDITHVVHLISTTQPKSSNDDILFDVQSNVIQTLIFLDLCIKYKVKKLLYISSGGTVYGVPKSLPVSEEHSTEPICSYGIGKLTIEKYLALYRHLHGLSYVIIRASNPYGPYQNPLAGQGVVANYIHRMHNDLPLEVWGDGSVIRDFIYIDDLVVLIRKALFSESEGVFNAGSGGGTSIKDLIMLLSSVMHITPDVFYKSGRNVDVPAIVLDCAKAESVFGWKPSASLASGVACFVSWYRDNFTR